MSGVRAKRLRWRPDPDSRLVFLASGIGGQYRIDKRNGQVLLWWAHDECSFVECDTVAAAKEQAEQDWQARFALRVAGEADE